MTLERVRRIIIGLVGVAMIAAVYPLIVALIDGPLWAHFLRVDLAGLAVSFARPPIVRLHTGIYSRDALWT